jgi:hypothetical protein
MFLIYKFIVSGFDENLNPISNQWLVASQHSQLVDAQAQLQRFIDSGINSNYLRQLTDQDAVPSDIPTP